MRSLFRKHAATIVVAFITAAVVAGPAGLYEQGDGSGGSVAVAQTATNCPTADREQRPLHQVRVQGWAGPPLPGTPTTIATLPLGKGKYVINAKLYVQNSGGFTTLSLSAACQLVAGPNFDWAKQSLPPTNTNGIQQTLDGTMSLTVANTFTSAGIRRAQVQRRHVLRRPWCFGSLHQDHRAEGGDPDQGEYVRAECRRGDLNPHEPVSPLGPQPS